MPSTTKKAHVGTRSEESRVSKFDGEAERRESLRAQKPVDYVRAAHGFVKDTESDDNYEPDNDPDDGLDDDNVNAVDAVEVDDAAVGNRERGAAEETRSRFEDLNEDVGAREHPSDAVAADAAREKTRDDTVEGTISCESFYYYCVAIIMLLAYVA
ncbi:uncharacterized protein KRP23_13062 [Phytophthora ramorum]|uniref:uncharacterized protein n=1 Tax=Phytophthora ramorum TaxID=164328 RepID=UPI0030B31143|nr:hypothetical protein KRP23_13062 [Phytophthora ramorum]